MARFRWTDSDVVEMASQYVANGQNTLTEIESQLGVSHSTIWWCITRRLKYIDGGLYLQCMVQLSKHKGRHKREQTNTIL